MRKVSRRGLSRSLIAQTLEELVTNQGLQALGKMDMIMEFIKGFWSILCNDSLEKGSSARFNAVTDVIYP